MRPEQKMRLPWPPKEFFQQQRRASNPFRSTHASQPAITALPDRRRAAAFSRSPARCGRLARPLPDGSHSPAHDPDVGRNPSVYRGRDSAVLRHRAHLADHAARAAPYARLQLSHTYRPHGYRAAPQSGRRRSSGSAQGRPLPGLGHTFGQGFPGHARGLERPGHRGSGGGAPAPLPQPGFPAAG